MKLNISKSSYRNMFNTRFGYARHLKFPGKYILTNHDYKCRFEALAGMLQTDMNLIYSKIQENDGYIGKYGFIAFRTKEGLDSMIEFLESIVVMQKLIKS